MARESQDADDKMWPPHIENIFIEIMVEEQIKGNMENGVFKSLMWETMTQELNKRIGKNFTAKKVFQKHNRLRGKQSKWSQLLNRTSLGWDKAAQTVTCTDKVWVHVMAVCYFMHFKFHVSMVCLCFVLITLMPNNCSYACVVVG